MSDILEKLRARFKSGNTIEVPMAMVTQEEFKQLEAKIKELEAELKDEMKRADRYLFENKELEAEREWVSVEDRLPEHGGRGLCLVYDLSVCNDPMVLILSRQDGFWTDFDGYDVIDGDDDNFVTHWMPLPQSPKG